MLYLIGGPPRVGKSLLGQRLAAERRGRWVATDFLRETFADVVPEFRSFEWHEAASMAAHADRFCVYFMERFAAMASSPADEYVTEGLELIPPVITPTGHRPEHSDDAPGSGPRGGGKARR